MEDKSINLNDLSKQQLVNLVLNLSANNSKSSITFFDIKISSNEPLLSCEETLNRIIEKHKGFLEYKKNQTNLLTGYRMETFDDE